MAAKRKVSSMAAEALEEPVDPSDELMFLALGGGNEVGRSCHIIQYKGKTVMLDAGMHPAYDGLASLPFYDEFDLSTIDILLISHFHIDHAASLPYVLAKTNFRGRIFMTHSTKAIYKWLIQDSVRVGNTSSSSEQRVQLYTEVDHLSTFPQIEAIDYYTTHTISSIRITPYPAGHVLGAAMFLIEIAGLKILFTGDYSRENGRHLIPAEVPKNIKIDVLITESTFGLSSHIPRLEREAALMKSITGILNRGGRALLPVFALGMAQELLLILDEYWGKHPELQKIPIYYASNLARKCMVVYQTYIGTMNDNIKRMFRERMAEAEAAGSSDVTRGGPWDFRYIRSLKSLDRFDDVGGCVMLASPGMMQTGVSRELLERWAPDPKNGVVITGYSVEGTMAKMVMTGPESIPAVMTNRGGGGGVGGGPGRPRGKDGEQVHLPLRCSVEEYSFAAHVDGQENREFIEQNDAPVVILVHGEKNNMTRLKSKLLSLNKNKPDNMKNKIFSPANCEELRIPIRTEKLVRVVGKLADQITLPLQENGSTTGEEGEKRQKPWESGQMVSGVLVQNDLKLSLMAPEDLREYAGLTTTTIMCRQKITLAAAGIELVKWALEGTFGGVEDLTRHDNGTNGKSAVNGDDTSESRSASGRTHKENIKTEASGDYEPDLESIGGPQHEFLVMDTVTIFYRNRGEIELEWKGTIMNDAIADAVIAVLLTVESSPASVKQSSKLHSHVHANDQANGHSQESTEKVGIAPTPPARNPHSNLPPHARLSRLLLFLEAQFGTDAITPNSHPRLPSASEDTADAGKPMTEVADKLASSGETFTDREHAELARLHALGVPVPGLVVRVDKLEARIWLEDLSVECANGVFRDRVARVVQRGVECVSGLWAGGGSLD